MQPDSARGQRRVLLGARERQSSARARAPHREARGRAGYENAWLHQVREDLAALQRAHEQTLTELRRQNEWAEQLNREMAESSARMLGWIHDLEARIGRGDREIERLNGHVAELEAELEARSAWGRDLEAQIGRGRGETVRLNAHREELEADLAARAAWGANARRAIERARAGGAGTEGATGAPARGTAADRRVALGSFGT